jgi:hypothetical protein
MMIEMGMSYHDPGDIRRSGSHSAEAIGQRLPSRPAIPARIDDNQVVPAGDDVGEGVTEWIVRNWHRDRPQIRPDALYRRKGPRKPRFPLRGPGHPHRLITIASADAAAVAAAVSDGVDPCQAAATAALLTPCSASAAPIGRQLPGRGNWTPSRAEARVIHDMVEDPVALVDRRGHPAPC